MWTHKWKLEVLECLVLTQTPSLREFISLSYEGKNHKALSTTSSSGTLGEPLKIFTSWLSVYLSLGVYTLWALVRTVWTLSCWYHFYLLYFYLCLIGLPSLNLNSPRNLHYHKHLHCHKNFLFHPQLIVIPSQTCYLSRYGHYSLVIKEGRQW